MRCVSVSVWFWWVSIGDLTFGGLLVFGASCSWECVCMYCRMVLQFASLVGVFWKVVVMVGELKLGGTASPWGLLSYSLCYPPGPPTLPTPPRLLPPPSSLSPPPHSLMKTTITKPLIDAARGQAPPYDWLRLFCCSSLQLEGVTVFDRNPFAQ